MSSLEQAWNWYRRTVLALRAVKLLSADWGRLPGDLRVCRNDQYIQRSDRDIRELAEVGLDGLGDAAIVKLFAAFEATIRHRLAVEIEHEQAHIVHPVLQSAARDALDDVERGSFARVLRALKGIDPDLVERVRAIRRYRNWVTHGKPEAESGKVPSIDPRAAYQTLSDFLLLLDRQQAPSDTSED